MHEMHEYQRSIHPARLRIAIWTALVAAVVALLPASALAQPMDGMMGRDGGMCPMCTGAGGGAMMVLMWSFGAAAVGALVALTIFLIRRSRIGR